MRHLTLSLLTPPPLLRDICKATPTLLLSGTVVQAPCHTDITGDDIVVKLAVDGTPSDDFPLSCPHLRSQIRSQLLQQWQVGGGFPFSPTNVRGAAITHGAAIAHNNHTKTSQNSEFCNSNPQQKKMVQTKGMVN